METLAGMLQRRRRERRLSLFKAAAALAIPRRYLQAIEAGNFQFIPPGYRQLYLRDYAHWLGIDEKHALALFRRDYSSVKDADHPSRAFPKNRWVHKLLANWQLVTIMAFTLLIAGYLGLEYYLFQRPPGLSLQPLPAEVHKPFVVIQGQARRAVTLKLNDKLLLLDEDGNFKKKMMLIKGENWFYLKAVSPSGSETELKKKIVFRP